jgi:hypothetical protein
VARGLRFTPGDLLVLDRGYVDFAWLYSLQHRGVGFVTRLPRHIRYRVCQERPCSPGSPVLADRLVRLSTYHSRRHYPEPLRLVHYRDPEGGQEYVFLTNLPDLPARTVADLYRQRWQIETFFRWIKQNLKIKCFYGTSENAVLIQIRTAMIVYLLLCYTKFLCNLGVTLQNFMRILQLNLFRTCTVKELFEPPGPLPDNMNVNNQLTLAWA